MRREALSFPALAAVAALGLACCVLLNAGVARRQSWVREDRVGIQLPESGALESAFLFGMGMRRLAADLGLIRLLLYYGGSEDEFPGAEAADGRREAVEGHEGHEGHGHAAFDSDHPERSFGGGRYPLLGPMSMRILDLDPSYSYPALFTAGALAFNLNEPQKAQWLLEYALKRDPGNRQYHEYLAAVGAHRKGTPKGVIEILERLVLDPECPTMMKNLLGFLYFKNGQREKAIAIYREIARDSRDQGYRGIAERMLRRLGA
ncbi:MAG: hypothetical protein HY924_02660 [Elusimicrobia bacterium]|nr:hypothetical protein [Elusimicrobiota bacterium]